MKTSILLPFHRAAGARLAGAEPSGVATLLTYGDVPAEYRAAQEECAVLDETDRGLVRAAGQDATAFLHRLLANTVRTLAPGQGNRNLLLNAKGKVLFDFDLALEEQEIRLSTLPAQAPLLAKQLDAYLFSEKVTLADGSEDHAPLALVGPRARDVARAVLGTEAPEQDHATARSTWSGLDVRATPMPVAGSPGLRLDGGPRAAEALWRALIEAGARPIGLAVRDILRVEAGAAAWGADVDENVYPQEARLERAFALDKGCYIGQEVVAKIDTYGGLNKRLVGLSISHDEPVARGTRLVREDQGEWRELGLVTSWAYSFALDRGMALGFVKRRHQREGTVFRLGDGPATATVVRIPLRAGAVPATGAFE